MTHPGHPDAALQAMRTRLRQSREDEVRLLCSPRIRGVFEDAGVTLVRHDLHPKGTHLTLSTLAAADPSIHIIKLARNYGQTPAFAAVDGYWTRRLPSRIANALMATLSGVSLHDFGTTFKAHRASVIKRIRLYGELHRFIPALASSFGARIAEVPISNVPRPNNVSHYGLARTWRVMADLITVRFLLRYVTRPLHFFGPIGFGSLTVGGFAGFYVLARKLLTGDPIFLEHGPLLLLSAMLIQAGVVLIGLGLLAEILTRVYVDGRRRRIYTVERVVPSPRMSIATPHARAR
jgi:hypothetical protein